MLRYLSDKKSKPSNMDANKCDSSTRVDIEKVYFYILVRPYYLIYM